MFFYITYNDLKCNGYIGIYKKIKGQMNAFTAAFGEAYYTMWSMQTAYLMNGDQQIEKKVAVTRREYKDVLISWVKKYHVDRTYVRYPFADKAFIEFLCYQKNNGIKSVLEIASYPYEEEFADGRQKAEDRYYSRMVPDYIEMISTYSQDTMIWGKKCISLLNGIDVESYPCQNRIRIKDQITFIAVASGFTFWNGFERLIEGLNNYHIQNGKYKVKIYFVGSGFDENMYKSLVYKYHLENQVVFCGRMDGKELNEIFDLADIAISSLGAYKKGIEYGSPLKGAEYCARGIPMVCGYKDIRFPDGTPFVLNVPNDPSAIDLHRVISFYEDLALGENYSMQIRDYAAKRLSWSSIMRPVIENLR